MDKLTVLHLADLHIDSPLRGLVAYEGAPVDAMHGAVRAALRRIVATAIERRVDAVVIAGDLYDGTWRDFNTGLFVASQFAALHDVGIPVVIVSGNHDAESQLTRNLRLPPNTTLFSAAHPESVLFEEIGLAVHGQSYAQRAVTDDLSRAYPRAVPGFVNVGLLHTCFDGTLGHDAYAPCTLEGLRSQGYDYWALGHVHDFAVLATEPLVVFPGNLQGRHIRERGAKGACLVSFIDGVTTVERLTVEIVRWERAPVDVRGAEDLDEVLARCRTVLGDLAAGSAESYAVRVELAGATRANSVLRAREEQLVNELRALALTLGGAPLWIEKLELATTPPAGRLSFEGDGVAGEIGRVRAELREALAELAAPEGARLASLASLRSQLRGTGEGELAEALGEAELAGALDAASELLATLLGEESGVAD